jgi:hypothetical protein
MNISLNFLINSVNMIFDHANMFLAANSLARRSLQTASC